MAKHKKKKSSKNTNVQQNIRKKAQRKMSGNTENREKHEKQIKTETTAALCEKNEKNEKYEIIKPEIIEEIAEIQKAKPTEDCGKQKNGKKVNVIGSLFRLPEARKKLSVGRERREKIAKQWEKFSKFVMETKKVSIPVIIIVYTVVIVSAALIIDNSYNKRRLEVEEKQLIEEMANARAHSADIILEKDVPFAAGDDCVVTYGGYSFTDRVAAQNAEKYSACYENTAENNTYLDVIINYENTGESGIRADTACVMTVNDGTRDYPCFAAAETDGGKNIEFASGQTVGSGETARIHYIFDVPKELERGEGAISAKAIIANVGYVINLRN